MPLISTFSRGWAKIALLLGLTQYFLFYNEDRQHQSALRLLINIMMRGTTLELVKQDWDSAIQLECEQGSTLNQAIIRLDNGVHFTAPIAGYNSIANITVNTAVRPINLINENRFDFIPPI
ncbi:MAG: hypothetical protein PHG00_17195 [Methylococcales bacterium]|nr:hypothetical protein [Methylococcales bacterium]